MSSLSSCTPPGMGSLKKLCFKVTTISRLSIFGEQELSILLQARIVNYSAWAQLSFSTMLSAFYAGATAARSREAVFLGTGGEHWLSSSISKHQVGEEQELERNENWLLYPLMYRLPHLINHHMDVAMLVSDRYSSGIKWFLLNQVSHQRIVPDSWMSSTYYTRWMTLLRLDSGRKFHFRNSFVFLSIYFDIWRHRQGPTRSWWRSFQQGMPSLWQNSQHWWWYHLSFQYKWTSKSDGQLVTSYLS